MGVIYPDEDLEDADWPKTQSWDLGDPDAFATQIAAWPLPEVRRFSSMPAYRAAPPAVRFAVEKRLAGR